MSEIENLSAPRAVAMADDWYDIATEDHFWMQWRHREVMRAIRLSHVQIHRALEIGCGRAVARGMLERDLGVPVDGCDLNSAGMETAKAGLGRLLFYDIFDQEPSMLGHYDAVFLLDVLEHIEDDQAFLTAALRHLRPGGVLIVNVPASMMLYSRYDTVAGHVRRYRSATLGKVFREAGLRPEVLRYWGMSMVPVLLVRKACLSLMGPKETIRFGFAPPNAAANLVLSSLMKIETALPFPAPFGTSLLAWGRFEGGPNE
ncbi:MAG: class I SAM-dependent methyltransferase [Chthoniobacterales bacterium]